MAAQVDASGRLYGFVGAFITIIDALVVMGLTLVFGLLKASCLNGQNPAFPEDTCYTDKFGLALWITSGLYMLHGIFELALGPWRVARPSAPSCLFLIGRHG